MPAATIVICVEAKLESGKSGEEEEDQHARYLRLCDTPQDVQPALPQKPATALIYLTAQDGQAEILESLTVYGDSAHSRARVFGLLWQDIVNAAETCLPSSTPQVNAILNDVSAFPRLRGLEYFRGMTISGDFPEFGSYDGLLFGNISVFSVPDVPQGVELIKGG